MQVTETLIRPLTEVKYLNAENVDRYRCIMRIFYENYGKLKYWLYQEDVYEEMIREPYFQNYRMEQCQQDLTALTEWKNLETIQDTRKVASIEEFKNRKFRYQMSEYSVAIERLVQRLENLHVESASLEPSLLERIRIQLQKFPEMAAAKPGDVSVWWNDLNNDFIRLNQNYQDYIRDLNSVRAEEMMKTRAFLVFKDRLIEYLRDFIRGLQKNVGAIEEILRNVDPETEQAVLDKIAAHEISIPRIDVEITEAEIRETVTGRYQNLCHWFVSEGDTENEAGKLFDATSEIIRRMTRYASQLSERSSQSANRREEYRKVAGIFGKCQSLEEAHRLSALVFGLEAPFHLKTAEPRSSESMNQTVYEEEPPEIVLRPRVRTYGEKTVRTSIHDRQEEKEAARRVILEHQRASREILSRLEQNHRIDFHRLPQISPEIRSILLKWLSDAMENPERSARTEEGRIFDLDLEHVDRQCVVHCDDGNFTMPQIGIVFRSEV